MILSLINKLFYSSWYIKLEKQQENFFFLLKITWENIRPLFFRDCSKELENILDKHSLYLVQKAFFLGEKAEYFFNDFQLKEDSQNFKTFLMNHKLKLDDIERIKTLADRVQKQNGDLSVSIHPISLQKEVFIVTKRIKNNKIKDLRPVLSLKN